MNKATDAYVQTAFSGLLERVRFDVDLSLFRVSRDRVRGAGADAVLKDGLKRGRLELCHALRFEVEGPRHDNGRKPAFSFLLPSSCTSPEILL